MPIIIAMGVLAFVAAHEMGFAGVILAVACIACGYVCGAMDSTGGQP